MEGKYYVYIWYTVADGRVFYVGKGTGNRVTSLKDRNRLFKWIRANHQCSYEIVRYFDNEEDAYAYELELGLEYKSKGEAKCCFVLGKTDKFISAETKRKISKALKGNEPWNNSVGVLAAKRA